MINMQTEGEAHFVTASGSSVCSLSVLSGAIDIHLVPSLMGLPPTCVVWMASALHGQFGVLLIPQFYQRCTLDGLRAATGSKGTQEDPFVVEWDEQYGATVQPTR